MEKQNISRVCFGCNQSLTMMNAPYEWQTKEFCSSSCLGTYSMLDEVLETCSFCKNQVMEPLKMKLCVRFGSEYQQFCSYGCLENFRLNNSFCNLCQERIQSFMVIYEEEKFCSPFCTSRYSGKGINQVFFKNENSCYICNKFGVHHLELLRENSSVFFCSYNCVKEYELEENPIKYQCSLCACLLVSPLDQMYKDGRSHHFCSRQCHNIFLICNITSHTCVTCKDMKYNFDMIKSYNPLQQTDLYFCSMKCFFSEEPQGIKNKDVSEPTKKFPALKIRSPAELNEKCIVIDIDNELPAETPTVIPEAEAETHIQDLLQAFITRLIPETQSKGEGTTVDTESCGTQMDSDVKDKEVQTDEDTNTSPIPMPFPVYIPSPVFFPNLCPTPMVIPVPVPIPIPIPLLKNENQETSLKEHQNQQDKQMSDDSQEGEDDFSDLMGPDSISEFSIPVDEVIVNDFTSTGTEDSQATLSANSPFAPPGSDSVLNPSQSNQSATQCSDPISPIEASSPQEETSSTFLVDEDLLTESVMRLDVNEGRRLWSDFADKKENDANFLKKISSQDRNFQCLSNSDRNNYLIAFLSELLEEKDYRPTTVIYVLLNIQKSISDSTDIDSILLNIFFQRFAKVFYNYLQKYLSSFSSTKAFLESSKLSPWLRIREDMLWDALQLGSSSPSVLLFTVFYFNTKLFMFETMEDHESVSFKHFLKHCTTKYLADSTPVVSRSLRYVVYASSQRKVRRDISENVLNPYRCPLKINEFYSSKCPTEAVQSKSFYFTPILGCCPESKIWFSSRQLPTATLRNMLNLSLMVEEVQEVLRDNYQKKLLE